MNALESTTLTEQETAFFNEHGYAGPFTLCAPEVMAELREKIDALLKTAPPCGQIPQQSRHLDSRLVFDLCSHPAIVDCMLAVLGPDLTLWRSNFFTKEPGAKEIPWHQDYGFWPISPALNVSAWLAIDAATTENACVQIVPGTHKSQLPLIPSTPDMEFQQMTDPAFVDTSRKVDMVLKPGEFFLFNECTLHHSNANRSTQRRLGLAVRMTIPKVKVNHDEIFKGHKVVQLCGVDNYKLNVDAQPPPRE